MMSRSVPGFFEWTIAVLVVALWPIMAVRHAIGWALRK